MADEFELRAFVAMRYAPRYDAVYAAIRETLESKRIKAIRADEIPQSSPIHVDIMFHLEYCDLVIVEVSEPSPNVYFEAAVAIEKNKPLILLSSNSDELEFNMRDRRVLRYSLDALDKLQVELARWIDEHPELERRRRRLDAEDESRARHRWTVVESLLLREEPKDSREEIKKCIKSNSLIPCRFLYSFEMGALRWLKLCSNRAYRAYGCSLETIEAKAKEIAQEVIDRCGGRLPAYISVGPGVGEKDKIILANIIEKAPNREDADYLIYIPIDVSMMLINITCDTLSEVREIRRRARPRAILADFQSSVMSIRDAFDEKNGAIRVFSMLGNTLGNLLQEAECVRDLRSVMNDDDLLLLEVRLLPPDGTDPQPGGQTELRKKFNFTPLEAIGVKYDSKKLKYIDRKNVSVIERTRTICGVYTGVHLEDRLYSEVKLTYIHHYDEVSFAAFLRSEGFRIIKKYPSGTSDCATVLFVLERHGS